MAVSPPSRLPDEFPVLQTGTYTLRQIVPSDAQDWHGMLTDPRVSEFTSTPEMSVGDVRDLIDMFARGFRGRTQIRWAVADPETGQMIGDVGYNDFHTRDSRAEVGYGVTPDYWRRGLMTAALSAVIDYGFSALELNKIEATVNPGNARSRGLLTKLGFQLEGTMREHRNRRGVFGDACFYGLLRREWPPADARG